jgi:beta-glucosidase
VARVTIGDVAAKAGVSIATVSKVINGRYGVASGTIDKVQAVITELGYESSLVARSLRSQRTNVIGIVVADIEPFSAELLKGAAAAIRERGYELIVYSGSGHGKDDSGWERRYISRLGGTLTDGIILVTPTVVDAASDEAPVVAVDPHTGPSILPSVHSDNLAGAIAATEHLLQLGHRRIGFLAGRPDLESARQREEGYRQALAAAGIAGDPELTRVGDYELEMSEEPARQLLTLPDRPTAIFAANDLSAVETMHVARTLGLDIPGDLSVVGFDNIPESAVTAPPLTTIDQSIKEMGREAVELIVDLVEGTAGEGRPRQITLPTRLVVRQSTARPPARRRTPLTRTPGRATVPTVETAARATGLDGVAAHRPVGPDAAYRDVSLGLGERIADLLSRMSLDEKLAQLGSAWVFQLADGPRLDEDRAAELLRHGIGQVTRISGASSLTAPDAAGLANEVQRHLLEATRLGIPAIVHEEICSGVMSRGSTVFPQAIGLASTWEPALLGALADALRVQMRATGVHQGLSPVLDICRDPRWGRTEETFGEDPYLVSRMGVAFVRGLQGDDLATGVIATAKHFVGYGASEGGLNWAPPHIGPRELREVYLRPFEAVVRAGGIEAVMNAYNELDGVPVAADRDLLTGVLREEWGFEGCVVSDYFAIRQLAEYHHLAVDGTDAAAIALDAGLDVELPGTDCYGEPLLHAVRNGRVPIAAVDTAVARVLRQKFELGLFEQPYVDTDRAAVAVDTADHRGLARTIATKSLVLLRNDGILPLERPGRIAVIGPNADTARHLFGDYTYPAHVEALEEVLRSGQNVFAMPLDARDRPDEAVSDATTIAAALAARFGADVSHARGCGVNDESREGFDEAVALAAASDVAVMVMGDKAGLTDDCTSGESRDAASLDLPGVQEDLVRAVIATGTPVVLVLVAGRPIASAWVHEHCAAVLMAWFPGQEGGEAVADVLAGEAAPGGKLPISYPRSVGQIPVHHGHKVSGGRSHWKGDYVGSPAAPLYPFGYGLGYTTFEVGDASLGPAELTWHDRITTRVRVTNTGERAGDDVVQLYVRDPVATVTRPVLELASFARVELAPGESRTVTFETPVGQLGFYDRDLDYVVEPGRLDIFVGTSSADLVALGSVAVAADPAGRQPDKMYDGSVTIT